MKAMKAIALEEVRANFDQYLTLAQVQPIAIVEAGKPVGFLIGLLDPDDWWEECLLKHPKFLSHVAEQRRQLRSGQGKTLEDIRSRYE
jgi:PHD/YefM family antitoxin component YafN of YafNO toxin-antitoxin module